MTDADAETPAEDGGGAPPRTLPLFYARPEVIEAGRHKAVRLAPHDGYGFAAGATAIPVNVAEFAKAAVTYPVVFAGRETLSPVVVTGLRRGQNLFVGEDGAWEAQAYVPAYARRYPFILTRPDPKREQVMLCLDMASPRVTEDEAARPLFEGDEPSELARNALDFCLTFQRQAMATEAVTAALREAGVLQAQRGEVSLPGGESLRLTDFHVVDEAALNALSDEAWLELRRTGAVAAAYCQLVSMNNWQALSRRAEARGPAAGAAPAAAPSAGED
jgi:hypothetical protein